MAVSIEARLKALESFRERVQSGALPQRTALGPGALQKSAIKSGSIDAKKLNVDTLESVTASTGDLTVTGTLTIGAAGDISVGNGGVIALGSGSSITLASGSTVALASGGELTVNGDITVGSGGAIRWGDSAEHSIEGRNITFQNGAEASAGRILFRSATDATRRSALRGYFGSGDADYPILVMEALDTDDANAGLAAWVGIGADFDTSTAGADVNVRDTGGITRASLRLNTAGQIHARATTGGSFAVIDASAPRTMLEIFPGGNCDITLPDTAGTYALRIRDSGGVSRFRIHSGGTLGSGYPRDATGGAGAYVGRLPIYIDGYGQAYLRMYAS